MPGRYRVTTRFIDMPANEYARRRSAVLKKIGKESLAIVAAAPERLRNRDVHYPYRQDSDFFYLTGFPEPEAIAVLAPGAPQGDYLLFCRPRDPERETWDGRRAGPQGAEKHYAADTAYPINELDEHLTELLANRRRVYHTLGERRALDRRLVKWIRQLQAQNRKGIEAPTELYSLDPLLHEMRLIKSATEIKLMRRAAEVSAEAHCRAMQVCRPGMMEYQLAAELHYQFERNGMSQAYGSIVGGGENGCILHYVENDAELGDGDLVLIDAGAENAGYAADITRTFPVNGRFSDAQRAVYNVVLNAQLAAIEQVRAGRHWNRPHEAAVKKLTEGLVDLGLLKGKVADLIENEAYRRFYMHSTGHWLGMDVHDVGAYKRKGKWRDLQPGMVLTVEPGLYITPAKDVDKAFWNIGIRIEDDVLVTKGDPDVLTAGVPKHIEAIEKLMAA